MLIQMATMLKGENKILTKPNDILLHLLFTAKQRLFYSCK